MVEVLVGGLLAILTGCALAVLLKTSYDSSRVVIGQNIVNTEARLPLDTLADQLRNAQPVLSGNTYQVIRTASATDITCYCSETGDTVRFWLDTSASPQAVKTTRTVAGVATTKLVASGVDSLQFTYYKQGQSSYTSTTDTWVATANPPAAADLPAIGAINIQATVKINGYSRQLSSFVRLRPRPLHVAP